MKYNALIGVIFFLFIYEGSWSQTMYKSYAAGDDLRLSNEYYPQFGVDVWRQNDLFTDNYKLAIDNIAKHTSFNFLIPFLRFPDYELLDTQVVNQVKKVTEYAKQKSIMMVPDLDLRSARRAFKERYPNELQQMLRIKDTSLSKNVSTKVILKSLDLQDHYSGGDITHHISLQGDLLKVYGFKKNQGEVLGSTIIDITDQVRVIEANSDSVFVEIPGMLEITHAAVLVAFTHLYPDIFSPHLMQFQREIIDRYKNIPLIGVCKDEWGFPPYYPRFLREGYHDFWYSRFKAEEYNRISNGRELLKDCLLMALGEEGKESERQGTINIYSDMTRQRNTDIEVDFYNAVKEAFGKDAVVTVHSTWWPYPDKSEMMKNGLDWWAAKRDWAQTDEVVPYGVRTALAKKWNSAVWYNMYYKADLAQQVWSSALGGGRIDYLPYHSIYPKEISIAESRIRLLNYIVKTPLDCRVAVVFGHHNAMNWASPGYDDVGMALVDSFWHAGYPADLIPTTEITNGSLKVDSKGDVHYGKQVYDVLVLYHPEFENQPVIDFLLKAEKGNTVLFEVGEWTKDFYGNHFPGNSSFPSNMLQLSDISEVFFAASEVLRKRSVPKHSSADLILDNTYFKLRDFNHASYAPSTSGLSYMIDGTVVRASGKECVSGDTIKESIKIGNSQVTYDVVGIVAVRLNDSNEVVALAAGGLKSFKVGNFEINLENRTDLALWRNDLGEWHGVIQGVEGEIPKALRRITNNWNRLSIAEGINSYNVSTN